MTFFHSSRHRTCAYSIILVGGHPLHTRSSRAFAPDTTTQQRTYMNCCSSSISGIRFVIISYTVLPNVFTTISLYRRLYRINLCNVREYVQITNAAEMVSLGYV